MSNERLMFRWDGQALIVTTGTSQHRVEAEQVLDLLALLDGHRGEIYAALEARAALPEWARPNGEPAVRRLPMVPIVIVTEDAPEEGLMP